MNAFYFIGQQMSNSAAQTVAAAASAASVVLPTSNTGGNSASNTLSKKSTADSSPLASATTPISSPQQQANNPNTSTTSATNNQQQQQQTPTKSFEIGEWQTAWKTWLEIGSALVLETNGTSSSSNTGAGGGESTTTAPVPFWPPPSQTFLTCYVDLVQVIVDRLAPHAKFAQKDFEHFSAILDKLLSIPVLSNDYSSFILMQIDTNLSPLQNTSLNTVKHFIKVTYFFIINGLFFFFRIKKKIFF